MRGQILMNTARKLILLFSLLAVAMTAANSLYFYNASIADLDRSTQQSLDVISSEMLSEVEQYVSLMDFAFAQLTNDVDFMNSFYEACQRLEDDELGANDIVVTQTVMSHTLFQTPILKEFYRVSAYAPNGFFLSNKFEITDTVVSMSDEAREIVASMSYLQDMRNPFQTHLVGPHMDPWSASRGDIVFTAVRGVAWRGDFIGYLEISASAQVLHDIFTVTTMDGVSAQAILPDGTALFHGRGDAADYSGLSNALGMVHFSLPDGSERLVVRTHSRDLGLDIYVAMDMSVYLARRQEILFSYVMTAAVILAVGVVVIVVMSLGLTASTRRLTRKMKNLSTDNLMAHPEEAISTMVTRRGDRELYHLEQVFNALLRRLQTSHQTEIAVREGALQAQLNALQVQINPHFVYNTLNIISAKGMESGSEEISDLCDQFAQMLRYANDLRSRDASLGDELKNARRYLALAKARYEDLLSFTIEAPREALPMKIPKLTIQPLLENALAHGFAGCTGRREIAVVGRLEGSALKLTVRDNGNGFDPAMLEHLRAAFQKIAANAPREAVLGDGHIGLLNTFMRLHYYSRGKIRMHIYNDGGAVVELTLPRETGEE